MRQRLIEGWPDHWYNRDGYIPCPAPLCSKIFNDGNINRRGQHWNDSYQQRPSHNDHHILLAINRQKTCVYCSYYNSFNLKELLVHEETQHGTRNMSTIQGYLHLMRRGLYTAEARDCRKYAYERLLINIWRSPYRNRILFLVQPKLLPHEADMWRDLEPIFSWQNRRAGLERHEVVLAGDFLKDLQPAPGNQSVWTAIYHEMRKMYAEGSI